VREIPDWKGKIVIDTTNNILSVSPSLKLDDLGCRSTGELMSSYMPGPRVMPQVNDLDKQRASIHNQILACAE
jgi:predicted dinucleotide-binding enzyme